MEIDNSECNLPCGRFDFSLKRKTVLRGANPEDLLEIVEEDDSINEAIYSGACGAGAKQSFSFQYTFKSKGNFPFLPSTHGFFITNSYFLMIKPQFNASFLQNIEPALIELYFGNKDERLNDLPSGWEADYRIDDGKKSSSFFKSFEQFRSGSLVKQPPI